MPRAYFRCGGFRTLGSAATPQNLLSIANAAASPFALVVERFSITMDATAVLITAAPWARLSIVTTLPSGGTARTIVSDNSLHPVSSFLTVLGATASDGGAATAITATAGAIACQSFLFRAHTLVGQILPLEIEMIHERPITLRPGTALLCQILATTGTSNPATNHYLPVVSGYEIRRAKGGTD